MAELATLARPYAEAAFKIADQSGTLAQWSQSLSMLASIVEQAEVKALLGDPRVAASQLADLFLAPASASQPKELRQFVAEVIEYRRLPALSQVAIQFDQLKNRREGQVEAEIQSAFPLESAQLTSLVADLERRYGRKVTPIVRVNPELIGGACVTVGDEVIDGSVRAKLSAMAAALQN
jgi:F-type H+-transporting ATPase subunit delta